MRGNLTFLRLSLALLATGCFLDGSTIGAPDCTDDSDCEPTLRCRDSVCVPDNDAGAFDAGDGGQDGGHPSDTGVDAQPPDAMTDSGPDDAGGDAGAVDHCDDGVLDPETESDVDCGGECAPCGVCLHCESAADCASGVCAGGQCEGLLSAVTTVDGTRDAYVRDDGAILLAYYAPLTYRDRYDPTVDQWMTDDGADVATPDGWAPTPCGQSGHIAFDAFDPSGVQLELECGPSYDDRSETLRTPEGFVPSLSGGVIGTEGASGTPGWGVIAARSSGMGRDLALCGGAISSAGGVALCDGTAVSSSDWTENLVSYSISGSNNPRIGCGRNLCVGAECTDSVWVWLVP